MVGTRLDYRVMSCGRNVPPSWKTIVQSFCSCLQGCTRTEQWQAQCATFHTYRNQTRTPPAPQRGCNSWNFLMMLLPEIRHGYPQIRGSLDEVTEECEQEGQPPVWLCPNFSGRDRFHECGPACERVRSCWVTPQNKSS